MQRAIVTKTRKNLPQIPTTNSNLKPETRGNKRSKDAQIRLKNDIFSLSANHNDYEIMNILKIPNSTYYLYKSRMYQEAQEIYRNTIKESMEYSFLHLLDSLRIAARVNQEIALDDKQAAKDRTEASIEMCQAQEALFLLIKDGPDILFKKW